MSGCESPLNTLSRSLSTNCRSKSLCVFITGNSVVIFLNNFFYFKFGLFVYKKPLGVVLFGPVKISISCASVSPIFTEGILYSAIPFLPDAALNKRLQTGNTPLPVFCYHGHIENHKR